MIEARETNEQTKNDLLKLYALSADLVEKIHEYFPGRKVDVEVNGDEENYWLDGKCYTISRRFYLLD